MSNLIKFEDLSLSSEILAKIKSKGFEEPSTIQARTIPILLENKVDLVAKAQTGTGKTAAFGIPLLEKLEAKNSTPKALILAPTRELAIQITEELSSLSYK